MSENLNNEETQSDLTVENSNEVSAEVTSHIEDLFAAVEAPSVDHLEVPAVETPAVEAPAVEAPVVEAASAPVVENSSVITTPSFPVQEVQALGTVNNGAIGLTTAKVSSRKPSSKKDKSVEDTVAVYSTKNVTWPNVGKVYRGYNIISKSASEKWLTRDHVRLATPEEVAKEYGK